MTRTGGKIITKRERETKILVKLIALALAFGQSKRDEITFFIFLILVAISFSSLIAIQY